MSTARSPSGRSSCPCRRLIGPDGEDADLTGVKIEVTEEENTGEGGGEENPSIRRGRACR